MAVHTPLVEQTISDFVQPFNLGSLKSFKGLTDGIENTNYVITLATEISTNDYILTLFEKLPHPDVVFYIELLKHLSKHGLPVPNPLINPHSAEPYELLMNKPALLLTKLSGDHPTKPNEKQCHAIGQALAQQHLLTANMQYIGEHSLEKIIAQGTQLSLSSAQDQSLLEQELTKGQSLLSKTDLPQGLIHGDLFRDNALFDGDRLTGLLDYYSATTGPLLLDIAITANDWCVTDNYLLDGGRIEALLSGYQNIRPLTSAEQNNWHDCLCFGAFRFWVSRLVTQQKPPSLEPMAQIPNKDPDEFRQRLLNLRNPPI